MKSCLCLLRPWAHAALFLGWLLGQPGQASSAPEQTPAAVSLAAAHDLYRSNRLPEARAAYRQLIEHGRLTGNLLGEAYLGLGNTFMFQEDYPAAFESFVRAGQDSRISPRPRARLVVQQHFAICGQLHLGRRQLATGRAAQAEELFRAALEMAVSPGCERAQALLGLAAATAAQRRIAEAEAALQQVLNSPGPMGDEYRERSEALLRLIELKLASSDKAAAGKLAGQFAGQPILFPPHLKRLKETLDKAGLPMPAIPQPAMGAAAEPRKPIGGGPGYEPVRTSGDWVVADRRQFLDALNRLSGMEPADRRGKVIYVPGDAEIDLSGQSNIVVPSGVTIASDRGRQGSLGGLISYSGPTGAATLLRVQEGARISGLRFRGDSESFAQAQQRSEAERADETGRNAPKQPNTVCMSVGPGCEIENCELARFARGIAIDGNRAWLHHNRLRDISPYPIGLSVLARSAILEGNDIQWMWHAVAATFSPLNSYVARNNVFREAAPNLFAEGVSGQFAADSHGLGDRFILHHNTFLHEDPSRSVPNRSICLADPPGYAWITANWFRDWMTADRAVWDKKQFGREPYKPSEGPKQIARWRDIPWHLRTYLGGAKDFDFRDLAAMHRDGSGGAGFWVSQNAYGPDKDVLPHTLFSTPEIVFRSPEFRRWPAVPVDVGTLEKGKDAQWPFYLEPALPRLAKTFAVDVAVDQLPELGIVEVAVFLVRPDPKKLYRLGYRPAAGELQELYRGEKPPSPGRLQVDAAELGPGIYGLCVEAADRRGVRASQLTWFEVPAARSPKE